jgi:hypothetical protein
MTAFPAVFRVLAAIGASTTFATHFSIDNLYSARRENSAGFTLEA